jgi:hypothetical protein
MKDVELNLSNPFNHHIGGRHIPFSKRLRSKSLYQLLGKGLLWIYYIRAVEEKEWPIKTGVPCLCKDN